MTEERDTVDLYGQGVMAAYHDKSPYCVVQKDGGGCDQHAASY